MTWRARCFRRNIGDGSLLTGTGLTGAQRNMETVAIATSSLVTRNSCELNYIYIYIYIYVCVCVCVLAVFSGPEMRESGAVYCRKCFAAEIS